MVPLDPSKSPKENADTLFHRAKRLEKGRSIAEGRKRENEYFKGRWWDTLLFGMLDYEWKSSQQITDAGAAEAVGSGAAVAAAAPDGTEAGGIGDAGSRPGCFGFAAGGGSAT